MFRRSTLIAAALVGFASLAQADNWMPAASPAAGAFISRVYVDTQVSGATNYKYRVYLKDSTTGTALVNICGNSSNYAHVNRGQTDEQTLVDQLRTARFTLQPVRLYLVPEGSGCRIIVVDHD